MAHPEGAYNPLETVLLHLTQHDYRTGLDACEGTVIFGAPGSGKTSTSGKRILRSFLKTGMGGLCLVAKGEETTNLLNTIRRRGGPMRT